MNVQELTIENKTKVIAQAKKVLLQGGLVVFPSDTVYGLAAKADSQIAISKLFQFKNRPHNKSVSIAVKDLTQAEQYVEINTKQKKTLQTLLPGPYTIALKSKHLTDSRLEAEDGTLAIRIPNYWFTSGLSQAVNFPYTATSANLHTKGPHYSIAALLKTLPQKKLSLLDLIIDYGPLPQNLPSTVLNLNEPEISMLRAGDYHYSPLLKQTSNSDLETKQIAESLCQKFHHELANKALVFVLQGELGAGKTVFSKGIGQSLKIENIVSPTFVIYYEYLFPQSKQGRLHHFDLYRIDNMADLSELQIPKLLKPQNLLIFEWGERIGSISSIMKKEQAKIILVKLQETKPAERTIEVYELT